MQRGALGPLVLSRAAGVHHPDVEGPATGKIQKFALREKEWAGIASRIQS